MYVPFSQGSAVVPERVSVVRPVTVRVLSLSQVQGGVLHAGRDVNTLL